MNNTAQEKTEVIIEKHSLAIRWFHWVNFPVIMLMIWSGILIYWANPMYFPLPSEVSTFLHIDHQLATGMGWHFFLMWFFTINGILYFSFLLISGEWRWIIPDKKSFSEASQVLLHDLKISKNKPVVRGKFNGAQRIVYSAVIVMGLGSLLTGIAIYKPVQVGWFTQLLGGYEAARLEHFILMILFILFFIIHVLQVMRAGWNNFRAMIAGYEIQKSEEAKKTEQA